MGQGRTEGQVHWLSCICPLLSGFSNGSHFTYFSPTALKQPCDQSFSPHDLWVTKIKKPMILCARSTSRSRVQSTKCRSRGENMWKVCSLYSQNNKIELWSNVVDKFFSLNSQGRKGLWAFFLIVLFGCWLAGLACSGYHGNLDRLFLGMGFSYLVNEIKFMLISSRYFRIRSKKRLKFVSSKCLSYQHLPTTGHPRYTKNGGKKHGVWGYLNYPVPRCFLSLRKEYQATDKEAVRENLLLPAMQISLSTSRDRLTSNQ